jgi:hypothetical protein
MALDSTQTDSPTDGTFQPRTITIRDDGIEAPAPDWRRIWKELDYVGILTKEGWWGDYGYELEFEEIMRGFALTVGKACRGENCGEYFPGEITKMLLRDMESYLRWYNVIMVGDGDDDETSDRVERCRSEVESLLKHLGG